MLLYVLVLSMAVSMDALTAGLAYGVKGIHMPFASLSVIGILTVVCTAVIMGATHLFATLINPHVATIVGATLLMMLGGYRLLLDYLAGEDRPQEPMGQCAGRRMKLSVGALLIDIMLRPEAADIDQSKDIDTTEAALLSLALSVDNVVAVLAASLANNLPAYTPIAMGGVQTALLALGLYGSEWLVGHRIKVRLPYLSGGVLLFLGLMRLV